jgi:hypothetical protein
MNRKTLSIFFGLFILGFIIFGIWFFFINKSIKEDSTSNSNSNQNFFPLTTTFTPDSEEQSNTTTTSDQTASIPSFRQLSKVPTSGSVSFERETAPEPFFDEIKKATTTPSKSFETVFRYIERSTGHIYETTERTLSQTRVSNTTIPRVYEAFFDKTGDKVVLRYVGDDNKTIETFLADIVKPVSTATSSKQEVGTLEGKFLDPSISHLITTNNELVYSYIIPGETKSSQIFSQPFVFQAPKLLHKSDLSQVLISKPNNSLLTLTTKADSRVPGFLFFVDIATGVIKTLIDDSFGLTTLTSPDGKTVLFSESSGAGFKTSVLDVTTREVDYFSLNTLTEKCIWSETNKNILYCAAPENIPFAKYPEDWYQGKKSFNDKVWRIDTELESYTEILNPKKETGQDFDIIKPVLTTGDEYLMFINKNNLTLWSFDLK